MSSLEVIRCCSARVQISFSMKLINEILYDNFKVCGLEFELRDSAELRVRQNYGCLITLPFCASGIASMVLACECAGRIF